MAVVQGIREKVHFPIYDSIFVEKEKQLRDVENSSILKFFVNVQGKTKLETNLQSASLLPHYNTFEARALRIVVSDFPPEFPEDEPKVEVTSSRAKSAAGNEVASDSEANLGVAQLIALVREADDSDTGDAELDASDPGVTKKPGANPMILLGPDELEPALDKLGKKTPAREQIDGDDGGPIIRSLLYNTVTTLYVGEKIMIQAPTWLFPAGAGPYSEGKFTTHGEPSPTATFRFAEPVNIDKQQNFRVEIEVPDADVFQNLQKIYGPFFIWVFLDGYMMRDVQ